MKTIGIIGGMGPMATVDLMEKIIQSTQASDDQDHIHILVDNNTAIPDRTEAILHGGKSPVMELVRSGLNLERMGADVLVLACNTAHYFLPQVQPFLHVPVLNMIEVIANECVESGMCCIGLLASEGTYGSGIYKKAFDKRGMKLLQPDEAQRQILHDMIYHGVKAGNRLYDVTEVCKVLSDMRSRGAKAFILGCTEIPIAVKMYDIKETYIDATRILAEKVVAYVGATCVVHDVNCAG